MNYWFSLLLLLIFALPAHSRSMLAIRRTRTRVVYQLTTIHTFTVLVDKTISVKELVTEAGLTPLSSGLIYKTFPKPTAGEKVEKEVTLFHFGREMSNEEIISEMDKAGYKPATIWEILALALKKPSIKRDFSIVSLGSTCYGHLTGNRLHGFPSNGDHEAWSEDDRFLAVSK